MKLFRSKILAASTAQFRALAEAERLKQFSAFFYESKKKREAEKDEANRSIIDTGRSWRADELRLKSNEDLHRLWYVLLKEKNSILADSCIYEKIFGEKMPKSRLFKLERSMARLQTVINERKDLREKYRQHLEDEYAAELKEKLTEEYQRRKQEEQVNPPITFSLLRAKYAALAKDKDDQDYIEKEVSQQVSKEEYKEYLREKYDYRSKKIIDPSKIDPASLEKMNKDEYITAFKNSIEEQLKNKQSKVSQEEVLRAHIRNWKMLDLKQRRVVLNYLNARRSKDAKSAFIKELNLLAQKIAYEEKNLAEPSA